MGRLGPQKVSGARIPRAARGLDVQQQLRARGSGFVTELHRDRVVNVLYRNRLGDPVPNSRPDRRRVRDPFQPRCFELRHRASV